jgi:hypothetical protein
MRNRLYPYCKLYKALQLSTFTDTLARDKLTNEVKQFKPLTPLEAHRKTQLLNKLIKTKK